MKRISLMTLAAFFLFVGLACAQVSIKAEVDKVKLTAGDILTYKLVIISQLKNTPKPQLPEFTGFNIISQAHSSDISFGKGGFEIRLEYI